MIILYGIDKSVILYSFYTFTHWKIDSVVSNKSVDYGQCDKCQLDK